MILSQSGFVPLAFHSVVSVHSALVNFSVVLGWNWFQCFSTLLRDGFSDVRERICSCFSTSKQHGVCVGVFQCSHWMCFVLVFINVVMGWMF